MQALRTARVVGRFTHRGALAPSMRWAAGLLKLPQLSPTMPAGKLVSWDKKEGETVKEGDSIATIETDKAAIEWVWMEDPIIIVKHGIPAGTKDIPIDATIGTYADTDADVEEAKKITDFWKPGQKGPDAAAPKKDAKKDAPAKKEEKKDSKKAETKKEQPAESDKSSSSGRVGSIQKVRATPAALSLLGAKIQGSGPEGAIKEEDVKKFLASKGSGAGAASGAAGEDDYEDIEVTSMRKTIARRLTESKQDIPHFYLTIDINTRKMTSFLASLNEDANKKVKDETQKVKITVNDFIVKASAAALKKIPQANSQWHDDVIRQYNRVDISVAVATPKGLMTPIVFNADLKGFKEISSDIRKLATAAKDGKLQPDQYTGGTFTISNLGMFGIKQFTAIINPPQSCILAVGATRECGNMSVTLSCDHRVVDGAVGAQWLQEFKNVVENPTSLLL